MERDIDRERMNELMEAIGKNAKASHERAIDTLYKLKIKSPGEPEGKSVAQAILDENIKF